MRDGFRPGRPALQPWGVRPSPCCLLRALGGGCWAFAGARLLLGRPPHSAFARVPAGCRWRRCDSSRLRVSLLCSHFLRSPVTAPALPAPPSSPLSSSSQLPSRTCPFVDGALSSLSDTSSGPVLASPLIPFPVHTDLGLHEAGGLGACWGPLYWVNLGKEVLLVKASPEFGGHTLGPPEGGCLWAQLVGTDLQTPGWLCCDRGWVHPCPGYTVDVSGFPRSPPQSCSQTSECALRRGRKCSFITALPVTGHSSRWG